MAAVVACAGILWLARGFTFYFDEWDFILNAPAWNLASYLQPHNEHPSMLFRLVYAALLDTAGLRSYLPYMTVLLVLHAANVVLLFELVRRRAGDVVGFGAAALLLVLGAGWENLLWAFQLAWLASVAAGLGAFVVLEAPRTGHRLLIAVVLVMAGLMFSGIGLVFAVGVAVRQAADRDRRRDVAWLVPIAALTLAWFLAFGRGGTEPNPPPSAANVVVVPLYALWGLGASAAGIIGQGGWFGPPLLVVAALAVAWSWRKHGADPLSLGVAAALLTLFVITGLTRAQLGYQQAGAGRYVYEGSLLWIILLADAAKHLPWRGTWRPALVACVFLACFSSATLLFTWTVAKSVQMDREKADLSALQAERGDPCLNPTGVVDDLVMPQVTSPPLYYRAVDRYGDPAPASAGDRQSYATAVHNLRKAGC